MRVGSWRGKTKETRAMECFTVFSKDGNEKSKKDKGDSTEVTGKV